MRVLGVDFGTSNTVAMLRSPDGRVRPLLFDGSPLLPSAVYLGTDGRMMVGRDAERNARVDPSRFEPNPKRRVDDGVVLLGDSEISVPRLAASVLEQVAAEARRQIGSPPDQLRMTHPARWGERRRTMLVEAAQMAGLPRPKLIPEPVAAACYFTAVLRTSIAPGQSLAIYDLGGGTFDATVVRRTQHGFEVLAEQGLSDIGGLDFDHAIVGHLGDTYSESHAQAWQQLIAPQDGADRRHRRMLLEDVRGAKEMLSRTSTADIHLPALEVDAHVTRNELEQMIKPFLERTVQCMQATIAEAKLEAKDLVGIFLVGGSSRIPFAAHLLHTSIGVAPTTLEQPETVVAEGSLRAGAVENDPGARPVSTPPQTFAPTRQGPPRHGPPPGRGPMGPRGGPNAPVSAPRGPAPAPYRGGPPQGGPQQGVRPGYPPAGPRPNPGPPRPAPQGVAGPPRPVGPPPRPQPVPQRPPQQQPQVPRPQSAPPRPPQQQAPRPPASPAPVSPSSAAPSPAYGPSGAAEEAQPWYKEKTVLITIVIAAVVLVVFIGLAIWLVSSG